MRLTTSSNGLPLLPATSKDAATSTGAGADIHKTKKKKPILRKKAPFSLADLSLLGVLGSDRGISMEEFLLFNPILAGKSTR